MNKEPINIQMLGGFRICSGESSVEGLSKRAPKFWRMLQYLITFRHRSISHEELISVMWPESDEGDPGSSMRNMVFRIRSALVASGIPYAKEIIVYNGDGYSWNNRLDCKVDFEEFEKLYHSACAGDIPEQSRIEMFMQAIDLYKGDFLPNASCEMWAMPIASYYRALFFKCVHIVLNLLMEQERYAEVEMICKKALLIDQFDEKTNESHLISLIRQEKKAAALAEYQKMTSLFFEELGVSPSDSLREIYMTIQQSTSNDERGLEDLTHDWIESADFPGAYYCEYGVFKIVYQIEARSIMRSGKSIYIVSITIEEDPEHKKKTGDMMSYLHSVIQSSLRRGDLFTRVAPCQYALMLQGLTYEDCKMLTKRISRCYKNKYRSFSLKTKIRPMSPVK